MTQARTEVFKTQEKSHFATAVYSLQLLPSTPLEIIAQF